MCQLLFLPDLSQLYWFLTVTKCEVVRIRTQPRTCFVVYRSILFLRNGPTRARNFRDYSVIKKTDPISETLFLKKKAKSLDVSKIVAKFMTYECRKYQ